MTVWMRGSSAIGVAAIAVLLAACQSTGSNTANLNTIGAPSQLQPVQSSSVQQGTLPAIGATGTPAPGLSGQPVLGGVNTQTAMTTPGMTQPGAPGAAPAAGGNSSFVTLNQPMGGGVSAGPEGVWNVVAGAATCRINLPMTAKTGTSYYRASAPGCTVPQIASVTGWQQVGSQLQLYDENGNIAAFLAPSSGRYIGTISGGQAISMAR
ncbi:MAG: AprI/Inh family metalloprotease inhibitor [Candidatus Devosia phytovorans]|uniref:AprI/Inh family metalloprotease inhibitor n=1 Tax=Candidatus Devosia phytovorans TaxID=3121372 RepID=A0AAJ5VX62_9HYPH|nr:AprI/Inh family metalloprotease inhibitor [Devosia sp.]WEK05044.1 MAG: AprI/Inh family metalloprotease inhibitor [Devosia sp.]